MPVLPSVTWSTAVRVATGVAAARDLTSDHGESNAAPASAVEDWMNWRRLSPPRLWREFFMAESTINTSKQNCNCDLLLRYGKALAPTFAENPTLANAKATC